MTFKLSKAEHVRLDELRQRLEDAALAVEASVDEFRDLVEAAKDAVHKQVVVYNAALREMADWRDEFVTEKRAEWDERTEKWQEGHGGQAASGWIDEFENLSLDEIEPDWPEELEPPDMDHAGEIAALPDKPGDGF
jgi:hypothetical protein